ncbi:sulfatase family protein [Paenibacillus cremeus]|uniref:Sulfatase-like hydrolase/transferase n=1 Tax=Paenibacillus cremeus TaxID=2163881 RepID=A0A559KFS3_9BACL|nr:sulfatase-like hydrolase/transferase [Paenibacillus cremeus]TVY10969.1 sulfatase-like hydrolase/transferase [Paenibacillus cremeus]
MRRPNILFLFPDTHRGDWMPYAPSVMAELGMEPLSIRMPHMEALMQQGVTFTKAVTPSPLCAPARACLAAGLRYNQIGVTGNHVDYPLSRRTFYSCLKESGYRVGGVGKFDLHKATRWWGLDGWIEDLGTLGFTDGIDNAGKIDAVLSGATEPKDPYMKYLYDQGLADIHLKDMAERGKKTHATDLPDEAYCDNWVTRNGIQMLRGFPEDQPWLLMVNFVCPHEPFDITHRMKAAWENESFPYPNQCSVEPAVANSIRQNYAAMLENIDRSIGLLLNEIRLRGELDNTVIIYSSDHGDMLGDFDKFGKCKPERGSVHIPLVISGPGIGKGEYSEALVELQDLASTILDLAGVTPMAEAEDSLSLRPVLTGEASALREVQVSGLDEGPQHPSAWRMASDGEWKLIVERDRPDRLYHLRDDPWENDNVAEAHPDIAARLKAEIRC